MRQFLPLVMAVTLAFAIVPSTDSHAQAAAAITKMAKDFGVSPKTLTKFSKKGLSDVDLGNGLKLAKDVADKTGTKMEDALDKVLGLREKGKDWPDIAGELDVPLPSGLVSG